MKEELQKLNNLERNLRHIHEKKGFVDKKLFEINSALKNITDNKKTYKVLGNFMVEIKSSEAVTDLKTKQNQLKKHLNKLSSEAKKAEKNIKELKEELTGDKGK